MTLPTLKEIRCGFKDPIEALYDMINEVAGGESVIESEKIRLTADAAAADVWEKAIFKAPFNCTVKEVIVVPDSNVGQATNFMTMDVISKGANGTGTTGNCNLNFNSTNPVVGMVGKNLPVVGAGISVSAGHVLSLKKTKTGDGEAFPGGLVIVKYTKA